LKLLLARHGNTFEAGVEPTIVGRGEDLPLTAAGEAQAYALAQCLQRAALQPDLIVCGSLQRTRRMAVIVADTLRLAPPHSEDRLTELDYGAWSGLTTTEVKARFGSPEYEAWENRSIMPDNRGWQPESGQLQRDLTGWLATLPRQGTVLAITSNGILRFVPRVMGISETALEAARLKVKTGHFCSFSRQDDRWALDFWNADPATFAQMHDKNLI
jgi:broad specificity phosphatase PhoE